MYTNWKIWMQPQTSNYEVKKIWPNTAPTGYTTVFLGFKFGAAIVATSYFGLNRSGS